MIPTGPATKVYLSLGTTDLRKGFEGLGDLVRHQMKEDPLSGHLFVFTNRSKTRIKLLYWDGSGTWLLTKRLAKGRFSVSHRQECGTWEWGVSEGEWQR